MSTFHSLFQVNCSLTFILYCFKLIVSTKLCMPEWGRLDFQFSLAGREQEPVSLTFADSNGNSLSDRAPGWAWPLTGLWSPQDPLGFHLWDIVGFSSGWQESGFLRTYWDFSFVEFVGFSSGWQELGPSRRAGILALGHCGVQFRLTGAWFPQDLLVIQVWDIVGIISGWWESGLLRTCRE